MSPARFALASLPRLLFPAAVLAAFSLVHAQEIDALAAEGSGTVVSVPDSAVRDSALQSPEVQAQPPSALDSAVAAVSLPAAKKSVLYLGGGEYSPWFHLGVLYAIEAYSVPVDSVVGTSWGAYIGALWAKGVSPDDIQRCSPTGCSPTKGIPL